MQPVSLSCLFCHRRRLFYFPFPNKHLDRIGHDLCFYYAIDSSIKRRHFKFVFVMTQQRNHHDFPPTYHNSEENVRLTLAKITERNLLNLKYELVL